MSEQIPNNRFTIKDAFLKCLEWYRYFLTKWIEIVIVGLLGGALGFIYASMQKPVYKASLSFVIDDQDGGGGRLSGALSLASQFGFDLKDQIKIICSGKVITGFDIIRNLSLGADLCNSARGMMFALGCIQALECHANTCPTGVATQDPELMKGLVPEEKSIRVARYQKETVKSAMDLMASAGISHPNDVDRIVVSTRIDRTKVQTFYEIYPELDKGCLLFESTVPKEFMYFWKKASAEKF